MTVTELLERAKTLSAQERKELVKLLVDSLDVAEAPRKAQHPGIGRVGEGNLGRH
jgi:hypothetical protein